MKKNVVIALFFSLLIEVSSLSISSYSIRETTDNLHFCLEYHIIKNVDYVGQETGIDCEIASFSMLLKYLDKNCSLHELFYLLGAAHGLGFTIPLKKTNLMNRLRPSSISPGSLQSIWVDDWSFVSNLFGLKANIIYNQSENNQNNAWGEYWNRVKYYISQDKPVFTMINMSELTRYKEDEDFPSHYPMCHAIVIVGYNQSNKTVCIHDPEPGYYNESEKGTYVFENVTTLQKAVTTSTESPFIIYRYGYVTITLDEIADSLPKKQAFEMAHYRNLGKLDGSLWAYDEIYRENSLFGVDATIQFQKNMKPLKFLIQIPKYWIANRVSEKFFNDSIFPFDLIPSFIYVIKQEKEFASDALFNNNFDEVLKYEGEYLKNESNKWNEYYNLYLEFVNNLKNFGLVKTIINSTPILLKMNNILDEIISIQELILENN